MLKNKKLFSISLGLMIPVGLLVSPDTIFAQKYRVILPPRPQQPPALNNTVQSQIANQNVGFNTSSSITGGGGGGFGQGGGGTLPLLRQIVRGAKRGLMRACSRLSRLIMRLNAR